MHSKIQAFFESKFVQFSQDSEYIVGEDYYAFSKLCNFEKSIKIFIWCFHFYII